MLLKESIKELLNEFDMTNLDERDKEVFQKIMPLVFSKSYIEKIFKFLKKIDIRKMKTKQNIAAYQQGNAIYINLDYFDKLNGEKKTRYLLHEFLHILQTNGKFKEVKDVSLKLYNLIKSSLPANKLSVFLTGKAGHEKYINKWEVLTYLMNGKVNMKLLPEEVREKFIEILEDSEIFNLKSTFWQKTLKA